MKKRLFINLIILITVMLIGITVLMVTQNKEILKESAQLSNKFAINTSSWDTNKVTPYTDSNGAVVPIPKGYVVSGVSGENVVKTGLVIYEGTSSVTSAPTSGSSVATSAQVTRNQWVWVPVPDASRIFEEKNGIKVGKIYTTTGSGRTRVTDGIWHEPDIASDFDNEYYFTRYSLQGISRHKFYQDLQINFEETIQSIQKYGGFYIGRYQTGDFSKSSPVVKKLNGDICNQSWYEMYSKMQYMSSNSNLKTSMIWGCLWDETVQWLVDTGCKTYKQVGEDATTWGNYSNSSFSYIDINGNSFTKPIGGAILPTGCTEFTKSNNIYDLAGNVHEWILETHGTDGRRTRGGAANISGTSATGGTYITPGGPAYYNYPFDSNGVHRI